MSCYKYFKQGKSESLENFLAKCGVSSLKIEELKKEKNEDKSKLSNYYTPTKDKEYFALVPVNKIVGIDTVRGKRNESWFENLLNYSKYTLSEESVIEFLRKMDESTTELRTSFTNKEYSGENLNFYYYKNNDIYVCFGGGSHRTLFSKISGAEYIYANVRELSIDEKRLRNYKLVEEKLNTFKEFIYNSNLKLIIKEDESDYTISYKKTPIKNFKFTFPNNYSNIDSVNQSIATINREKTYLEEIFLEYHKVKKFPKIIREIIIYMKINTSKEWKYKHLKTLLDLGWNI